MSDFEGLGTLLSSNWEAGLILAILFLLAIACLIVGVSNDAVNFLVSAVGSKVANRHVCIGVAGAGIVLGASLSSGMMQLTRDTLYNPSYLDQTGLSTIFLSVMLSNIIILSAFNALGLPTSSTVAIVFELLGSAFAIGTIVAVDRAPPNSCGITVTPLSPLTRPLDFVQMDQIQTTVSAIFLSVAISIVCGAAAQLAARFAFTYTLDATVPLLGPPFGGIALTAIAHFVLIKGLSHSRLLPESLLHVLDTFIAPILAGLFVVATIALAVAHRAFGLNPLRVVVLCGTFALAMAFAGNDLVNFIGPAVTQFQVLVTAAHTPECSLSELALGFLHERTSSAAYLLVPAGIIMVVTMWTSSKSRRVLATSVELSRQVTAKGERFAATPPSRALVRGALALYQAMERATPKCLAQVAARRLQPPPLTLSAFGADEPAFDLLRAAINLVVSSSLIATASSLTLPLSTTYVTFMVSMGTSLADKAWSRDVAAYRVAGVLTVITGWFVTAFVSFTAGAIVAVSIYALRWWVIGPLFVLDMCLIGKDLIADCLPSSPPACDNTCVVNETDVYGTTDASAFVALKRMLALVSQTMSAVPTSFETRSVVQVRRLIEEADSIAEYAKIREQRFMRLLPLLASAPEVGSASLVQVIRGLSHVIAHIRGILAETEKQIINLHTPPCESCVSMFFEPKKISGTVLDDVEKAVDDSELGTCVDGPERLTQVSLDIARLQPQAVALVKCAPYPHIVSSLVIDYVVRMGEIVGLLSDCLNGLTKIPNFNRSVPRPPSPALQCAVHSESALMSPVDDECLSSVSV